jgi:hypothetical protein
MDMLALMAALVGLGTPLRFELQVPKRVASGEKVEVRLVARNVSDRPVVVTKLGPNGTDVGARFEYDVARDGAKVERDARGNLIAQWMLGSKISERAFRTLQPGESFTLMEETFANELPRRISLKSEWATMPRTPLKPGIYTARAKYAFYRTFDPKRRERSMPYRRELTPEASRLYHRTWTGAVDLVGKFEVVSAS